MTKVRKAKVAFWDTLRRMKGTFAIDTGGFIRHTETYCCPLEGVAAIRDLPNASLVSIAKLLGLPQRYADKIISGADNFLDIRGAIQARRKLLEVLELKEARA